MSALEELLAVAVAHERALERAQRAGEERALAVYRARAALFTLAEIARVLRVPRSTVPALARRGAQLARSHSPEPGPVRSDSPEPATPIWDSGAWPELDEDGKVIFEIHSPEPNCARPGCPRAVLAGTRLCSVHFYG